MIQIAAIQFRELIQARNRAGSELADLKPKGRRQFARLWIGGMRESLRRDYPMLSPRFEGRLEHRARRAAMIAEHSEGGLVGIIYGGRDCDGFEAYQGDVIPASVIALEYVLDIADHGEGFFGWELCSPQKAREHGYVIARGGWDE
jgi:hypothetical protein